MRNHLAGGLLALLLAPLTLEAPARADDGSPWAPAPPSPVLTTGDDGGPAALPAPPPGGPQLPSASDERVALREPLVLAGRRRAAPWLRFALEPWCLRAEAHVALDGRVARTSAFAVDRTGTESSTALALSPRARVSLTVAAPSYRAPWVFEFEQDVPTGTLDRTTTDGLGAPDAGGVASELRRLSLRVTYGKLIGGGGVTVSHWGLGLVANDGAHGWEPGSARFADLRGGDRVLRGYLATGPYTRAGLGAAIALDRVLDDDALLTDRELAGRGPGDDHAYDLLATVTVGVPTASWAGAYVARRSQRAADGRELEVTVLDASAIGRREAGRAAMMLGGELAVVLGTSGLVPTATRATDDVLQVGAAVRGTVDLGRWGVAVDGVYASGDRDLHDGTERGFRASTGFDLGLILFPQVVAAQTARGVATASNPNLVAQPPAGLERLPTRGAVTNTLAVFPRAVFRQGPGNEFYGGPLLAWTAAAVLDPYATSLAGGAATNALGGRGGSFLGAELDVGFRRWFQLWGVQLTAGAEAGLFKAGSALQDARGETPGVVASGRVMLGARI